MYVSIYAFILRIYEYKYTYIYLYLYFLYQDNEALQQQQQQAMLSASQGIDMYYTHEYVYIIQRCILIYI
jgi:hypothetical protein